MRDEPGGLLSSSCYDSCELVPACQKALAYAQAGRKLVDKK